MTSHGSLKLYNLCSVFTRKFFLAAFLCAGFLLGFLLFLHTTNNFTSLMCSAPFERVSIVGVVCVVAVPFLFSVIAVHFSALIMLFPIAFLEGITFSYCACHVVQAFSDAGWLVRCLLMFSDSAMLIPLFWFMCRNISGKSEAFKQEILVCGFCAVAIGLLDFFMVSPFLVTLFTH